MESSSKALASSATQASADLDSVYATFFFDEISSDVFENDCMTDMVEVHVIEDDAIEENVILKEVLENLAKQISSDKYPPTKFQSSILVVIMCGKGQKEP